MKDLSVIIVSYNVREYLHQCLLSVERASQSLDVEVWVVDNNSPDGTVEYLRPYFPDVHFIQNTENVGFSRANNQALRACNGRYALLLNPDTFVGEDTLRSCVDFMDQHPQAGAMGVSMYGSEGAFALESRRGLPVPWTSFCKMTGLTHFFPHSRLFGRYYMDFLPRDKANPIEVISGAFNMMRTDVVREIGYMDEDFFMYGEDVDLSYRIMKAGWQNWYLPSSIIHYKGESTHTESVRYVNIFYQAMIIFINKHFRHRYRFFIYLIHLAVYARAGFSILMRMFYRLRALLSPGSGNQTEHAVCIMDAAMAECVAVHCQKLHIHATTGDVHDAEAMKKADYVIFPTSEHTYAGMIDAIVELHGQYPGLHLGVYHPELDMLILP